MSLLRLLRSLSRAGVRVVRRDTPERVLHDMLLELGPVFIKIGQVLSTRRDVLPDRYLTPLATLREAVPPEPFASIEQTLERSYPDGPAATFRDFEREPVAAGAVAQVHFAVLHDGKEVAVKVLRPGIDQQIQSGINAIKGIVRAASFVSGTLRRADALAVLEELETLLMAQADLEAELRNYELCAELFEGETSVRVPRVYPEHSSREVLVLDRVQGVHPDDHRELSLPAAALATRVDSLMDLMFEKGFCHADLHPGNFFWTNRCQIVLIDLGLAHVLSQRQRSDILVFYHAVAERYFRFAAHHFATRFLTASPGSTDSQALIDAVASLVERHVVATNGHPRIQDLVPDLFQALTDHRARLHPTYVTVLLTLATIEGYVYELDPAFDMLANVRCKRQQLVEEAVIPDAARQWLVPGATCFSVGRFDNGRSFREAEAERDRRILDALEPKPGDFVIDLDCAHGALLERLRERGARVLGLAGSDAERDAVAEKGLAVARSDWVAFAERDDYDLEPAAALVGIECLVRLANLRENLLGLLDMRLIRFFEVSAARLKPGGRFHLQCLNATEEFLRRDAEPSKRLRELMDEHRWLGAPSWEQVERACRPLFSVVECEDASSDLREAFGRATENTRTNERELRLEIGDIRYDQLCSQLGTLSALAHEGSLGMRRALLVRRPAAES